MGTQEASSTAQHKENSNSNSNNSSSSSNRRAKMKKWEFGWLSTLLLVSVTGGLVLGWWEYEYHPKYRQLWMVPFGLILLITPLVAWLSLIVSDLCSPNKDDDEDEVEVGQKGKNKDPPLLIPVGV